MPPTNSKVTPGADHGDEWRPTSDRLRPSKAWASICRGIPPKAGSRYASRDDPMCIYYYNSACLGWLGPSYTWVLSTYVGSY